MRIPILFALTLVSPVVAQIPLPNFTSTFSSANATRGFYFQTPVAIVVTGLRVPDETKHGLQNVEVFKMTAPPPAYPATGSGTQVFYKVGQPSNVVIPCSLIFNAGDYIGVLGGCGDTSTMRSSYGAGAYASNVLGNPITLMRFLTQTNIVTTGGNAAYSSEGSASIARVEVFVAGQSSAINYGTGFGAGSAPAPTLNTTARPIFGQTATLSLTQSHAVNSGALLALAGQRGSLPFLGGTLLVAPPIFATIPVPGTLPVGATPINLPIPNDKALISFQFDMQAFVVVLPDLSMTNGVEWVIGY